MSDNNRKESRTKKFIKQKLKKLYLSDFLLKLAISLMLIFLLVNSFRIIKYLESITVDYNDYFERKLTIEVE